MVQTPAMFRTAIAAIFAGLLVFAPAQAQQAVTVITTVTTVEWVEDDKSADWGVDWDADDADGADGGDIGAGTLLGDDRLAGASGDAAVTMQRFAPTARQPLADRAAPAARYGPFTMVSPTRARMAGDVTSATPRQFAAMLAAHPGLRQIDMVDCPGSLDEEANLRLARMIRAAGLSTHVPSGGSVRSGAVELWLAGVHRSAADSAEFGVHSWRDEDGREARDYPAHHPVHREYIDFYRDIGLDGPSAQAFYAMTNATPFDQVRTLSARDMARYVPMN